MPKCSKCCRCSKYMWLIGFQILLIILFFFFVKHETAQLKAALYMMSNIDFNKQKLFDLWGYLKQITALLKILAEEVHAAVPGYEGTHAMIYVGFGLLTTFLMKYCFSALGITMLVAALVAQWSIFTRGVFYMTKNIILLNKTLLIRADFMTVAVLITFGSICGRANVNQLLFIGIFEAAVGSANLYLLESVFQISDIGGSIGIHAFGAFFGMCVSSAWNFKGCSCRRSGAGELHPQEISSYMSDTLSMLGTLFLFVYWPTFNSALTAPGIDEDMAIANTYISIAACTVTTFALSSVIHEGKFGMEHIQNSTLAGGVAIGAAANMHLMPYAAIIVGILASVMSVFGITKLKTCFGRYCAAPDTRNVMFLHGFPGVFGGIVSAVAAVLANRDLYGDALLNRVFPAMKAGRTSSQQALYQLCGTAVSILIATVAGAVCGLITRLKCFKPLNSSEQFDDVEYWKVPQ